jgi:hypothetical protein
MTDKPAGEQPATKPKCPHGLNRQQRKAYVIEHANPEYRPFLQVLYHAEEEIEEMDLFGGAKMDPPYIEIGPTGPKALAKFHPTNGFGGYAEVVIHPGLLQHADPRWVVRAWPSPGTHNFIRDFLLRFAVIQYMLEVEGSVTREQVRGGWHDYGRAFTRVANRVGKHPELKLDEVFYRREEMDDGRGTKRKKASAAPPAKLRTYLPLAAGWPHTARPDPVGHYRGDVTREAMWLAGCRRDGGEGPRRRSEPSPTGWRLVLELTRRRRFQLLARVAERQVAWLRADRGVRADVRRFEEGLEGPDGEPLRRGRTEATFDPKWMAWEGGTAGMVVESIVRNEDYETLPALSDCLEDAGCTDPDILGHLRAHHRRHGATCWVLVGLLDARRRAAATGQS